MGKITINQLAIYAVDQKLNTLSDHKLVENYLKGAMK